MPTKTEQTASKPPVKTLRLGAIKATIWENTAGEKRFYGVTLSRTYRDEQQNFRDSRTFGAHDLLAVAKLANAETAAP